MRAGPFRGGAAPRGQGPRSFAQPGVWPPGAVCVCSVGEEGGRVRGVWREREAGYGGRLRGQDSLIR